VGAYSNASGDAVRRIDTVTETMALLNVSLTLPYEFLVVHLGQPDDECAPGDNRPELARRSLEQIAARANEVGVQVAVEIIPNALSSAPALVNLIEKELEGLDVGVCLDYGHAHLMSEISDTVETLSGHVVTTHVHDNRGTRDEHLVPFAGTIDWDSAMMSTQKVGYDGVFILEISNTGNALNVLRRSEVACKELERRFVTL
jgi:sugar phosphate isomerase/epimerase